MVTTGDPLVHGPVPVPPGGVVNDPAGVSAGETLRNAVGQPGGDTEVR